MINIHYLKIDNFKKDKLSQLLCKVNYYVNHYVSNFKVSLSHRCGKNCFMGLYCLRSHLIKSTFRIVQ